jgi:predicted ABC-type transport system involved in lysophospholipase L1 biosynthesis ATPase subunit
MSIDEKQLDMLLPLAEGHHKHFSILLLMQEHCGFCEQAQEILKRLSREYWLSVSTLDMGSPEGQRLALAGGLLFPPGVLINGEPFSYGRLSERKLRRELDRCMGFVDRPPYVLASHHHSSL